MQSTSYIKRQKELRRLEKQQQKRAKRAERAVIKRQTADENGTATPQPIAPHLDSATLATDTADQLGEE